MDSFHKKRLIVLTSVTLSVVVLSVAGLFMLNEEMNKALMHTKSNMGVTEVTETPNTDETTMEVEW